MGIFTKILSKIFPSHQDATAASAPSAAPTSAAPQAGAHSPAPAVQPGAAAKAPSIDVEAHLNQLAAKNPQKLNWRTSIVDLMKLLDLDNSLESRKELATELGYSGNTSDSAAMNIWLHKQVMKKVAENGGKVPAELTD